MKVYGSVKHTMYNFNSSPTIDYGRYVQDNGRIKEKDCSYRQYRPYATYLSNALCSVEASVFVRHQFI